MTKKEETLEIIFRFKITKKDLPKIDKTLIKTGVGLYQQLKQVNKVGLNGPISLQGLNQVISNLYIKNPTRNVKIVTNQAGMDAFNNALLEEQIKKAKEDEYRKKFRFRSKIFKQTYKFGQ